MVKFKNNFLNKDYLPVLAQDLVNLEELMDTFWKENNYNSTPKKLIKERNDLCILIISFNPLYCLNSFIFF